MPTSGSFNRFGVNVEAPARARRWPRPRRRCFWCDALFVAPLATYLPMAVVAGLLFVVAWGLIDLAEMRPACGARSRWSAHRWR